MGRMLWSGVRGEDEHEGGAAGGDAVIDDGPVDRDRRRFLQAAAAATALAYAAPAITGVGSPRAYAAVSPPPDQVRHEQPPKAETGPHGVDTTEVRHAGAVEGVAAGPTEQLPRTGADTTRLAAMGAAAAVAGGAVLRSQSSGRAVTDGDAGTTDGDETALD